MSKEIICGYIVDEAMFKERNLLPGTPDQTSPGILNTNIHSFFADPVITTALHSDRYTNLPDYETGKGDMGIIFDTPYSPLFANKVDNNPRSSDIINIFNIVEYLLRSNCLTTSKQAELEEYLVTNTGNIFTGYVQNTMSVSKTHIEGEWNSVQSGPGKFDFETSITFEFNDGTNTYVFKLYVDPETFVNEYLYSTIGQVIPPCDPINIINTNFQSNLDAIIVSSTYINKQIKLASVNKNYTSNVVFKTDYNKDAATNPGFPFGILYHGKEPTVAQQRGAIRTFLTDTGIVTDEEWLAIFPEIYTDNRYLIIPAWDNVYALPGFDLLKCSIHSSKTSSLKSLLPEIDPILIDTYTDILVEPNGSLFLFAIPDGSVSAHISDLHPTYQSCDATGTMYAFQTEETKNFNERLSACLAQLKGTYNTYVFNDTEFYGIEFKTFYVNTVEYCVMKKPD